VRKRDSVLFHSGFANASPTLWLAGLCMCVCVCGVLGWSERARKPRSRTFGRKSVAPERVLPPGVLCTTPHKGWGVGGETSIEAHSQIVNH
jgi:hypothetical protein